MGGQKSPETAPPDSGGNSGTQNGGDLFFDQAGDLSGPKWKTPLPPGVVLTGGSSLLEGNIEIAESVFNLPGAPGHPHGASGGLVDVVNNPMYATGVGLVIYGARNRMGKKFRIRDNNIFNRIMNRMKIWFKEVI